MDYVPTKSSKIRFVKKCAQSILHYSASTTTRARASHAGDGEPCQDGKVPPREE